MRNAKTKLFSVSIAILGFAFVAAIPYLEARSVIAAGEVARICSDITFGTTTLDSDGTAVTATVFSSTNLSVSSITATRAYCKGSGYACRLGSSAGSGSLTFNFSSSYIITKAKILAFEYGTDGTAPMYIQTSALTSAMSQTVTTVSAPDISNSSTDSGYVFTGLDGGSGAASSTFTISTTTDRLYLAKIVFTISGSSSAASSSPAASSSTSVSNSSSSSSSALSSSSSSSTSTYYRVAPKTSSSSSATVYTVTSSSGSYYSTSVKTLSKGTYYTSYPDVAAYYQAFGEVPVNYMLATSTNSSSVKASAYATYGEAARLWFQYSRTDGYMTQLPVYNTSSGSLVYYEIDISSDWSSYSSNRGALRLVALPYGCQQYGSDSVIFYTGDHYSTFFEYFNYSGGWGPNFAARTDYVKPTTVSVSYS